MNGWKIPEREGTALRVDRMRELRETIEPHISNQHVVSKPVLKGFAAPGTNGLGWNLVPFDVRRKIAMKPRGLRGCGKSIDFLTTASHSAELIWKAVEDRIPDAVQAAREGALDLNPEMAGVAKDCLALHLVRSHRFKSINADAVAKSVLGFERRIVDAYPQVFIREFQNRHGGLVPGSRASLEEMVRPFLEDWRALDEAGAIARAGVEVMFGRVRAIFARLDLQVWRPPPGKEFLISDSPCITLRYRDGGLVEPNVAIGDSDTVVMPIARDCLLAIAPRPSDGSLSEGGVDFFNRLQIYNALDHFYYRPGSNLSQWSQDNLGVRRE